ncbi:hypothetical protein KSB_31610 [Ktedonobacter robiniae]|uniref:Aldehyde oxidase/xanthine dehydrogenase second molybdopterin binding domain-containing protein n=1 Tax=Ktedonobacter robiniae TaxID=2778365 RepID=A0ABQ3UPM8_9CHLR|nr:hypothetical protein KSB_31610 [Ktedonobacter robiniae]
MDGWGMGGMKGIAHMGLEAMYQAMSYAMSHSRIVPNCRVSVSKVAKEGYSEQEEKPKEKTEKKDK